MTAPYTGFAKRLRELREAARLTQQALADKAGLSSLGIARLEQQLTEPRWATVIALAKALGVATDAFLPDPAEELEPPPKRPRGRPFRRN